MAPRQASDQAGENAGLDLSLVIPCYEESARLPRLERDLLDFLSQAAHLACQVVLVNDGSRDDTLEQLIALRQRLLTQTAGRARPLAVEVLDQQPNQGKGQALVTGVAAARGQWVLTLDADMACQPQQVLQWEAAGWLDLRQPGGDCVFIGSREHQDSQVRDSWLRHLAGRCFNILVQLLSDLPQDDTQCGFKLYPLAAARAAFPGLVHRGWEHDIELLKVLEAEGWRVRELPVAWEAMAGSKIKLTRDAPRMAVRLLAINWSLYWHHWLGLGTPRTATRPRDLIYRRLTSALLLGALLAVLLCFRDFPSYGDDQLQHSYGRMILDFFLSGFRERAYLNHVDIFYYGGLFELPAYALSHLWPAQEMYLRMLFIGLSGWLAFLGCARLGGAVGGAAGAFWGCLLLVACPQFFGQMFNQSKDIPFAAGYVWTLYYLVRVWSHLPRVPRGLAVKLGLALGAALGVRVGGGILVLYLILLVTAWLAQRWRQGRLAWSDLRDILASLAWPALPIAYVLMIIAWPWAWQNPLVNPFMALAHFAKFPSNGLYMYDGAWFRCNAWPWYYPLHAVGLRLPDPTLWLLPLFPLAAWLKARRPSPADTGAVWPGVGLVLLGGLFPLLYAGLGKATLYYGIRQILFVLPPLCLLAGLSLAWIAQGLRPLLRRVWLALAGAAFLAVLALMVVLHPWQQAYFNCTLAGGLVKGATGNDYQYAGMGKSEAYRLIDQYLGPERTDGAGQKKYKIFIGIHHLAPEAWDHFIAPPRLGFTWDKAEADFVIGDLGPASRQLLAPYQIASVRRLGLEILPIFDLRPLKQAWARLRQTLADKGIQEVYTLDSYLISEPFDDPAVAIAFQNPVDRQSNAFVRDRLWRGRLFALAPGQSMSNPEQMDVPHLAPPDLRGVAWLERRSGPSLEATFRGMGLEFQVFDSPPFRLYYGFRGQPACRALPAQAWRGVGGDNPDLAWALGDRNQDTQWSTSAPQAPGQRLVLDLGRQVPGLCRLDLWAEVMNDLPAGLQVETSLDGQAWQTASLADSQQGVFTCLGALPWVHREGGPMRVGFSPRAARYLRLTQTGQRDRPNHWAMIEMQVYAAQPGAPAEPAPDPAQAARLALELTPPGQVILAPQALEGYLASAAQGRQVQIQRGELPQPAGTTLIAAAEDEAACRAFLEQARWPHQVRAAGGYAIFRLGADPGPPAGRPLEPSAWRASSALNPAALPRLQDGDPATRWDSGHFQAPGQEIAIELGRATVLGGLHLDSAASPRDYPRQLRLLGQTPGQQEWRELPFSWVPRPPFYFNGGQLLALGAGGRSWLEFPPQPLLGLRLILEARQDGFFWSIHELQVLAPRP